MSDYDAFIVKGVGCWCPDSMTLQQARLGGHTKKCREARQGWEANYRHLSRIEQQRRIDAEIGRQIREAAAGMKGVAE